MKYIPIYLTFLVFILVSCEKHNEATGDLNVTVTLNGNQANPVENATVFTKPASIEGKTDVFGSVLLTKLNVGSYEVFATIDGVGSGKSTVNVKSNELSSTTVNVVQGIDIGIAPSINLILPGQPAEFSVGDTIHFSADVSDDETLPQDLKVKWESDLDGLLNSDSPNSSGHIAFATSTLSSGLHTVTLTVEDGDGYKAEKSFQVSTLSPKSIRLDTAVVNQGKVELSWSVYNGQDFSKYEIYRTNGDGSTQNQELLATISDVNTHSFTDELPPIKYQVGYYVRVTNNAGKSRNSNEQVVDLPAGPVFNFVAFDMLVHPNEPYIYLINNGGQKLIKIDYNNLKTVAEVDLQGTAGKCAIGDNGSGIEIYVPSDDGNVYVYNADDLSLTTKIYTGKENSSVAIDGQGHVIVALDPAPDPWWEQPLRSFNRNTGVLIDGNGEFERDIIKRIPGTMGFISISTSVSPIDLNYFELAADGSFTVHQDDSYHGDYPLDPYIFRISDDGTYVITANDGSVYTANSKMVYLGKLQGDALKYSDFAFSSDGKVIYASTSNRKSIQIADYPSLIRNKEILLNGYPVFVVRAGDKLITLSKSDESSITTGIEVVTIPN